MKREKKEFLQELISSGRCMVNLWKGEAFIYRKDRTGFLKWVDTQGYLKTMVEGWNVALHEVIAVAGGLAVEDTHEKLYINHIDGNKKNCRIHNLEVVNNSKNNAHAWKIGLKQPSVRRLSLGDVLAVKFLWKHGYSQAEIASAMDISPTHVSSIVTGHRWGNVRLADYKKRYETVVGSIHDVIESLIFFDEGGNPIA